MRTPQFPDEKPTAAKTGSWPEGWWKLMELRVGIQPLPILLLLVAVVAVGGVLCAEIGRRVPLVKDVGGAAILSRRTSRFTAGCRR